MTDKEFKRALRRSLPTRNETVESLFKFLFILLLLAFVIVAKCDK